MILQGLNTSRIYFNQRFGILIPNFDSKLEIVGEGTNRLH